MIVLLAGLIALSVMLVAVIMACLILARQADYRAELCWKRSSLCI